MGNTRTDYILDGQNVIQELRGGTVYATYLTGPRGVEYRQDQYGQVRWYLYDGLGSVIGEVDENGNVTATRKYDVYGAIRGSSGESNSDHKFVGGLGHTSENETGLIYMRARYYDPVIGRFTSEDPAGNGANWFVYANNNPVNYVDPTGEYALLIYLGAIAVGGLVGGITNMALTGDWSFSRFATGFLVGAVTTAAAFLGPEVGAVAGALLSGVATYLHGGNAREVAAAIVFGGVAGAAGGALGLVEGTVAMVYVESIVIGLLTADAQAYSTFFD